MGWSEMDGVWTGDVQELAAVVCTAESLLVFVCNLLYGPSQGRRVVGV